MRDSETKGDRKRERKQDRESEYKKEIKREQEDGERENVCSCRWGLGQALSFRNQLYSGALSLPHV